MYAKFPDGAAKRTDPAAAAEILYDAVIVGGGIAGAIIASRLSNAGKRVLILEAGPAEDLTAMNERWATFLGERAAMRREPGQWMPEQLERLGIAPEEITHVLLTPLQAYTTANVPLFPNAELGEGGRLGGRFDDDVDVRGHGGGVKIGFKSG